MPTYKAPLKDIHFVLNELLDIQSHYQTFAQGQALDEETMTAIIEEAAKFSENILAPLNEVGDREGCQWNDGNVTTPPGFKEAYDQFCAAGWTAISQPEEYGGQGLPGSLRSAIAEIQGSANHAWTMYPGLTAGGINTISAHADKETQDRYLPKLISGEWCATMCLTESHCGSDLGLLKTKAEPNADGTYNITGTKIFISSGDHDLTDNIIHIVLARLPDAPPGIKGISLFLVPKVMVNDDSSLGERNAVNCGSIEHKMGIHGNATCVMNFDGAKGYLISPPHKGMSCMFTFINESRLGVAMHALGHIEVSYQNALAYAKDRLQMRAPKRKNPDQPADPIIVHPDVRRMLLTQKALAEGGRMLNYFCAKQADFVRYSDDEEKIKHADALLSILTPIAKGFLSELGIEATNIGMQVLGGHGFISEWGQEQHVRDARILALYEGTSGIQGLDLLGRKILGTMGKALEPVIVTITEFTQANADHELVAQLQEKVNAWIQISQEIGGKAMQNPDEVNGAALDYLMFAGYTLLGYFWARAAVVAEAKLATGEGDAEFYKAKIATAKFYFARLLPRTQSHLACIRSGVDNLMALEEEAFAF